VDRSASEQDIKKAYKRLSRKYHPDKNHEPGAEDKFVEVAHGESYGLRLQVLFFYHGTVTAYEILSDHTVSRHIF
jgi:hypothetical protein